MRRSPLPRSIVPLARRKPLAAMSSKRRAEKLRRDNVRKIALWRAHDTCEARLRVPEVECWGPLDVDEIIPRSAYPGGHLDPDNCQVLCRAHHQFKHDLPAEAHARGLRRWSWERTDGGGAA